MMFITLDSDKIGKPGEGMTGWHTVSLSPMTHRYHISIKQCIEGRFVETAELVYGEGLLHQILSVQTEGFQVVDVQTITPPWINGSRSWRMEILKSVSIGYCKHGIGVCLLEIEDGRVYAATHDRSFDVEALTKFDQVYCANTSYWAP